VDAILPLAAYAFVMSITPGPNNLMLAASGIAFGMRRTVPHMLGISVGFSTVLIASGLGVGTLMTEIPAAALALKVLGTGYLIYLTWRMRNAFSVQSDRSLARPMSFVEASLFQYVNPKAWLAALTGVAVFLPGEAIHWTGLAIFVAVFFVVGFPCIATWTALGTAVRRLIARQHWSRALSAVVMLLMGYTIVAIWLQ
jgi:threonine/homoserine/homoserine lactone efflux protein